MYDEDRKKEGEHEWLEKKMTCHEIDCKVFPETQTPFPPSKQTEVAAPGTQDSGGRRQRSKQRA